MITRDAELHAANIEKINAHNDLSDQVEAASIVGCSEGLRDIPPRTGLTGEIAKSYAKAYQRAKDQKP